jgi:hypothetical protein
MGGMGLRGAMRGRGALNLAQCESAPKWPAHKSKSYFAEFGGVGVGV